jgi:N-acetylglucosamine kinase-like BadF-type ATPase
VQSEPRYVIGVDGGGTKTEALLGLLRDGEVERIATAQSGPGNLQVPDLRQAITEVDSCIESLFKQFPEARGAVATVCFSMAGTSNVSRVSEFQAWVGQRNWSVAHFVTHDARPLITAGTTRDCGIALIAGTGSFAYGIDALGREHRCGGWGSLLGDEGSGYWLAIEGLRAAVHGADGRGPKTMLLEQFTEWFGGQSCGQWPMRVAAMQRREIARGASVVLQGAENGDQVALEVLTRAGEELARHVHVLAKELFAGEPFELALAGGLLVHSEQLRKRLQSRMVELGLSVQRVAEVTCPAYGAALLAANPPPEINRISGGEKSERSTSRA